MMTVFCPVLAIAGAAIVYWVLMSNFLFSTVEFIFGQFGLLIILVQYLPSDRSNGQVSNTTEEGVFCPNNQTGYGHTFVNTSTPEPPEPSDFNLWGQFTTVPVILVFIIFPLVNLKSITFFTKFNSLGTVSILFILCSVLYRCWSWGLNAEFTDVSSEQYVPLFK